MTALRTLSFSGHQTFPLRYPWPQKGVQGVIDDPELFWREDALVKLGVGKNMVSAIRFWCDALGLVRIDSRQKTAEPTELGDLVFGSGGADPFLESTSTLWLIHWLLVHREIPASTWHLAFTKWPRDIFSKRELQIWLAQIARSQELKVSDGILKRDVDVFVRTYLAHEEKNKVAEESFDCPLAELNLIRVLEPGIYQFVLGPKSRLPGEIFWYALLTFWQTHFPDQETLSFERAMYDAGSPGAAFKLSENGLAEYFESSAGDFGVVYDDTVGSRTLLKENEIEPLDVIKDMYSVPV